jgi:hypothetical protein
MAMLLLLLLFPSVKELCMGLLGVAGHVILAAEPLGAVGAAEFTIPRVDHARGERQN